MANENDTKRGPEEALQDLDPQADPKGGRAGGDKQPYLEIKLKEVFISSVSTTPTQS